MGVLFASKKLIVRGIPLPFDFEKGTRSDYKN